MEQRITEDALKDCRCGSLGTIKRVIQPVAISFKGSGFYANDSQSSSTEPKKAESAEKPVDGTKPEDAPIPAEKPKTPLPESVVTSEK